MRKTALQTLIFRIETTRENQTNMDNIYSDLCNVIIDEMNAKIPVFDTSRKTSKRFKVGKPYWNDHLGSLWHSMRNKEKGFLKFRGNLSVKRKLREEFHTAQKIFDRTLKRCERQFRHSFCVEVENMTTSNPNEFWEKIKKLGPRKTQRIPMEVYGEDGTVLTDDETILNKWKTEFQNIYNTDNAASNFDDDFIGKFQHTNLH